MLEFRVIGKECYEQFSTLLSAYYREGEDAETDQTILDEFINKLYGLIKQNEIYGRLVYIDGLVVGFVLWMVDIKESEFSELPGYGTFLEIGATKENRLKGIGIQMVDYVENLMRKDGVSKFYISVYGSASEFWTKCGYVNTMKKASNDLYIYVKE